MGIGKRNKKLNAAAIKLPRPIGPIHYSDGEKKCEPMDVLKHLTSDYLRNRARHLTHSASKANYRASAGWRRCWRDWSA